MLDLQGTALTGQERERLQSPAVGGVIFFTRNYQSPEQLQELVQEVRAANPNLLLAVDQEGGRVQRFKSGFTRLPPLYRLGEVYREDMEQGKALARQAAWLMAAELLRYDIDISFAPVLDVYCAESRVIADRAFAAEPAELVALAREYIGGMHEAGMCATGKHFPGHGTVVADSHVELPVDSRDANSILQHDYRVFADCIDLLDAIMPAHVRYPALAPECAGFSRFWLQDKLRTELEFDGVIFSDDLSMSAAVESGSVEQRVDLALQAGCDMVLVCNDVDAAQRASEWIEKNHLPPSKRIATLRALPAAEINRPGGLETSDKWQQASAAMAGLDAHEQY